MHKLTKAWPSDSDRGTAKHRHHLGHRTCKGHVHKNKTALCQPMRDLIFKSQPTSAIIKHKTMQSCVTCYIYLTFVSFHECLILLNACCRSSSPCMCFSLCVHTSLDWVVMKWLRKLEQRNQGCRNWKIRKGEEFVFRCCINCYLAVYISWMTKLPCL